MQTKLNIYWIFLFVAVTLSFPIVAIQFTSEVKCSLMNFIVMGRHLFSLVLFIEMVRKKTNSKPKKLVAIGFGVLVIPLAWVEFAVGIFETPFAGS